jgi:putative ABC transport system permease protein
MRDWRSEIRTRLASLAVDPAREQELVDELAIHVEDRYRDLLAQGVAAEDATRRLLEELDESDAFADVIGRDYAVVDDASAFDASRRKGWGSLVWNDFRFGARALRRSPGFTSVVLFTLILSIGAAVTIFSLVHAVFLRPLPYNEPSRLVAFWGSAPDKGLPVVEFPDILYSYFRERTRVLESIAGYMSASFTLNDTGEPERITAGNVTTEFFALLGARPVLGRTFAAEEGTRGRNTVAVLSHGLWQRRFGGDSAIVGRAIDLNGLPTMVVGVMAPDFQLPARAELWVPLAIDPTSMNCWCYSMIGRMVPGATADQAHRELVALSDAFWRERDASHRGGSIIVVKPFAEHLGGEVRTPLLVLFASVGMVLLIACANIANLLLARGTARVREIALRCCLGASSWGMVRQLLAESLLLGLVGALGGALLAYYGVQVFGAIAVERVPHLQRVELEPVTVTFAMLLGLVAGVVFGLAPALRAARVDLAHVLKDGGRNSRGSSSRRLNHAFVVAQFALSLILLVGAALLLRSFGNLVGRDPGFRIENVLVARVSLPYPAYDDARVRAFYGRLEERLRVLPGIRDVGFTSTAPFSKGNNQQEFFIRGREPRQGEPTPVASIRPVTPTYFRAVGTPLIRGRGFLDTDREGAPPVAIVDESIARRYWPDGDAVGQRVRNGSDTSWRTIVGVVRSVRHQDLGRSAGHYVYLPQAQSLRWSMDLVVRTGDEPSALMATIRREVLALDARIPLYDVHTLHDAVAESLATRRLTSGLLVAFAISALLLAAVGIYGVIALDVSSRTSEFGIRLALGARPGVVRWMVLRQGMQLVLVGGVVGLAAAVAVTRLIRSLLVDVDPGDVVSFATVTVVLASVAMCACYFPARRATSSDPLRALRADSA